MRHNIPFRIAAAFSGYVAEGIKPHEPFAPSLEKAVMEAAEKAGLGSLTPERKRAIFALQAIEKAHVDAVRESGMWQGYMGAVRESTVSTDIQAFTTQSLAFIRDAFAPFQFLDLVTLRVLMTPRAFIHRMRLKRDTQSDHYVADSGLAEGLDPTYTEMPADCSNSATIHAEISGDEIEVEGRSLSWDICMPANYHAQSQYGVDLASVLDNGMQVEMQRAIQASGLSTMVNSAGDTQDYYIEPPADSYYETANPDEWARVLFKRITQADRNMLTANDGRVSANLAIGDVGAIGILGDLVPLQPAQNPAGAGVGLGNLGVNELATSFGPLRGSLIQLYRVIEGFPENTLIVTRKDDADPTFVHAQFLPFTQLQRLVDPKSRKVTGGAMTLVDDVAIRPDRIQEIRLLS